MDKREMALGGRGITRRQFAGAAAALAGVAALGAGGALAPAGALAQGSSFAYGTTGYGVVNDDAGLDPHANYSGWSCVRYGVGETLFRFSDAMEPEGWLAEGWERPDDLTLKVTLRDGVTFSNGRALDAQAVKECLDHLVATHDRAPGDLRIDHVDADGQVVTIVTSEPNPVLVNYLCDPYGAIVDVSAGVGDGGLVVGTGPYVATGVSETEVRLARNEAYWGGAPAVDEVTVTSIIDGDTLTLALQGGQIQGAYGLPYASYPLFADASRFSVGSCDTSRAFFCQMNYASPVTADAAVRKAIAMGIDKQGFVATLLGGRGAAAAGPFPAGMAFGGDAVSAPAYDPDGARKVLEDAGWVDADGDGIREKDGQRLTVRWLTYPSRQELPLLAESAQATLKEIGIDVQVNNTANHTEVRKDPSAWDVYASALVTAPTGDPQYFFEATCATGATKNFGGYSSPELDGLMDELREEFDADKRAELAVKMQRQILDDCGYVFASHLTMGIVTAAGVTGVAPHPCDYYEITPQLAVNAG